MSLYYFAFHSFCVCIFLWLTAHCVATLTKFWIHGMHNNVYVQYMKSCNQPQKNTNVLSRHFQGPSLSFRFFKALKVFALPTAVSSSLVVCAVLFQHCSKMWTAYVCCALHKTLLTFLFHWCYQHHIWWHRMWLLVQYILYMNVSTLSTDLCPIHYFAT